ncbi:DUF3667 domain-containing protein [Flagellimonas meridianipacifica]|uniref:Uncharacterized protein DUF3667 n=1 Tax=Flagellimonas meridianipacifica TaxID=1080225 RepID=A0A2T0MKC9_9FLAO|nr:DUF3667 domain-containing protein [Allomuricauda pacifica]PRX57956.1 uncharacterized protein DUF3667 [Allomuricauda pacifica]
MDNKPSLIKRGRFELKYRGTKCLNCGHELDVSDKFCPNCSQMNSTKKVTLKDFFDEFFSSLVNYDSKLLKTLSALLIRPGSITKDYINGKRITYTNPFRFLLSLAFLYFLMFTYNTTFSDFDRQFSGFDEKIINQVRPLSYALDSTNVFNDTIALNENAQKALKQLDSLDKNELKISETLKGLDSITNFDPKKFKENNDSLILSNPSKYFASIQKESSMFGRTMKKMDFFSVVIRKDTIYSFKEAVAKYQIEDRRSNRMPFNAAASLLRVIQAPGSFINATIGKLPFVIFFFLPIFTAFIWLVYIRKKYTYTDHLIFSFHNQSLLFILLILSLIIDTIFGTASAGWFLTIFGFYLYKAMRKFYGQGRFKTIVKYIFLNTIFVFLAFFTAILLFAGSAFTY